MDKTPKDPIDLLDAKVATDTKDTFVAQDAHDDTDLQDAKVTQEITDAQPDPVSTPPPSSTVQGTIKPKSNYSAVVIILLVLLLLGVTALLIFVFFTNQKIINDLTPKITVTPTTTGTATVSPTAGPATVTPTVVVETDPNQIELTGVIRESGLSLEDKATYNLDNVKNQITSLKTTTGNIQGYFLIDINGKSTPLAGNCVKLTGVVPADWKTFDITKLYDRTAIRVLNIVLLDFAVCNPYTPATVSGDIKTYEGKIVHSDRPSPDIGYDYKIVLDTPFVDNDNASGLPVTRTELVIQPKNDALWKAFEQHLNIPIKITGAVTGGYAESTYVLVQTMIPN